MIIGVPTNQEREPRVRTMTPPCRMASWSNWRKASGSTMYSDCVSSLVPTGRTRHGPDFSTDDDDQRRARRSTNDQNFNITMGRPTMKIKTINIIPHQPGTCMVSDERDERKRNSSSIAGWQTVIDHADRTDQVVSGHLFPLCSQTGRSIIGGS